jgi:ParB family chromosome partitioning protein
MPHPRCTGGGTGESAVFVLTETASKNADARTVERIVHQMVANDQRAAITGAQRARAIQTMLDTGVSPTKVAKIHRTKQQ